MTETSTISWLDQWLDQESTNKGDPTRRSINHVQNNCSEEELIAAVRKRNWCLIATTTHYIVIQDRQVRLFT